MAKLPRNRPGTRVYHVAFDTEELPGKVVGVRVELGTSVIAGDDAVRVDLAADPLYAKLEAYVLANPSGRAAP